MLSFEFVRQTRQTFMTHAIFGQSQMKFDQRTVACQWRIVRRIEQEPENVACFDLWWQLRKVSQDFASCGLVEPDQLHLVIEHVRRVVDRIDRQVQ